MSQSFQVLVQESSIPDFLLFFLQILEVFSVHTTVVSSPVVTVVSSHGVFDQKNKAFCKQFPSRFLNNSTSDNNTKSSSAMTGNWKLVAFWYNRLGHFLSRVLNQVLKSVDDHVPTSTEFYFCKACPLGKSHKLYLGSSINKTNVPLELIHTDVWGPTPLVSSNGYRYYINFVDDFTRYSWIYPLYAKI